MRVRQVIGLQKYTPRYTTRTKQNVPSMANFFMGTWWLLPSRHVVTCSLPECTDGQTNRWDLFQTATFYQPSFDESHSKIPTQFPSDPMLFFLPILMIDTFYLQYWKEFYDNVYILIDGISITWFSIDILKNNSFIFVLHLYYSCNNFGYKTSFEQIHRLIECWKARW